MAREADEAPYKKEKRVKVVSDNIADGAYAPPQNKGTAMALAQAVEEDDATLHRVEQEKSNVDEDSRIRVWHVYGTGDEPGSVPPALDKLVRSWGYEPARGEDPGDVKETHLYWKGGD